MNDQNQIDNNQDEEREFEEIDHSIFFEIFSITSEEQRQHEVSLEAANSVPEPVEEVVIEHYDPETGERWTERRRADWMDEHRHNTHEPEVFTQDEQDEQDEKAPVVANAEDLAQLSNQSKGCSMISNKVSLITQSAPFVVSEEASRIVRFSNYEAVQHDFLRKPQYRIATPFGTIWKLSHSFSIQFKDKNGFNVQYNLRPAYDKSQDAYNHPVLLDDQTSIHERCMHREQIENILTWIRDNR
jgi:hypothetical protein